MKGGNRRRDPNLFSSFLLSMGAPGPHPFGGVPFGSPLRLVRVPPFGAGMDWGGFEVPVQPKSARTCQL